MEAKIPSSTKSGVGVGLGTARGAGVVLVGLRTVCETTGKVLIFALEARVDLLVGSAGMLLLDVTGAGRSWTEIVDRFDMVGLGWIDFEKRRPN